MNARLLVLDEPTASLGSTEAERLHAVLRDLQAMAPPSSTSRIACGKSKRLPTAPPCCATAATRACCREGEITRDRLVQLMVGRALEQAPDRPPRRGRAPPATARLQLDRRPHGALPGGRGVAGRPRRRSARYRGPHRRGSLRAGRGDLRRRAAPRRTRPARRRTAGDSLGARRHSRRHLPGAGGSARAAASSGAMSVRENITLPALGARTPASAWSGAPPRPAPPVRSPPC